MKLSQKLVISFLLVGSLPLVISSLVSLSRSSTELEKQAFDKLAAIRTVKAHQLENYFEERIANIDGLAETVSIWRDEALQKLEGIREVKTNQVEGYFQTIESQIQTFSQSLMVVDAMRDFKTHFKAYRSEAQIDAVQLKAMRSDLKAYYSGPFNAKYRQDVGREAPIARIFDGLGENTLALQYAYIAANKNPLGSKEQLNRADAPTSYDTLHAQVHPVVRSYLERFGYYDIFLVDSESGDIVYSVFKELDYGTSLKDGPYADTNFARAFKQANQLTDPDAFVLVDYETYTPSYEAPASFIASPVFEDGVKIGVAIFQMPIARLNQIMNSRAGLGKTGETYLIGGDHLMRSDSYLDPENHSVAASFKNPAAGQVKSEAAQLALSGKTGTGIIKDYNDNYVLSAYAPVKIGGLTWAILAEIDLAEALNPKSSKGQEFYADFIEKYGYYDLFLIDAEGYCFYSVTKEADYQTNFVNGTYAKSGLGQLVREVMQSKQLGMTDYAPYAPSNGDPAAFAAQATTKNGKVDLIVAVQLSSRRINEMTQERIGLGETGETYLVGPDFRMRSDSFLDPVNRNIKASFAGSIAANGAQTEQVKAALDGQTGQLVGEDYRGATVLASYSPVKISEHLTWAIITEIDAAEAFAAVNQMKILTLTIGLISTVVVILLAMGIARSVANPIMIAVERMKAASGETGAAAGEVSSASQALAEGASEQAASLEETSSAIEEIDGIIQHGASLAQQTNSTAQNASSSSKEGQAAMKDLRTRVDAVVESAQEMEEAMSAIQQSSSSISKIIKTIDEIAFQTNILALNAAVEAARAGEAGAGFAVVADEVRNLAGRASEAARQTSDLIEDSVARSQRGAAVNKTVGQNLEKVLEKANAVDAGFAKIAKEVASVAATMNELESSASEQSEGIKQINLAVTSVSDVTQANAASAEEAASAAEELNAQAISLSEIVADLSTVIYGKSGNKNSKHAASEYSSGSSHGYDTKKSQRALTFDQM
jgi:methyl-accepting chemotaxis protein